MSMAVDIAVEQSRVPVPIEELVARVERIVRCRTGGRIRDLRVELQGTDVVISGVAPTYYAKQLATHAALDEIAGHTLTNAIEVL
jgi:hypothetical protein